MEDNLKHRTLDDTNSKDRQPNVVIERKDSQTGMKKNDYGNRRYTKNLNGIYYNTGNTRYYKNRFSYKGNHKQANGQMGRYNNYHGDFSSGQFNHRHSFNGYNNRNSHSLRNPSQSHDLYTNERNPRSRMNSENSQSSRDFTPSLQPNNIQFTNLPNQVQSYNKNEKNESVQSLSNLNNINPSPIMRSNTNYVMPETNKMCVCCSLNAKRKIVGDRNSCICRDNLGQDVKINPHNQYNIPPPKIENITDVNMKYVPQKIEEKTIYQYSDDKCLNYPKILKKEKNISTFEEDNLKEQHLAKSLPMVMSYKEAVQNTNDFEIPQADIQGNIGIPNNIVHNDQYFFQQTPINGFITPNPLLQNFNNSQYPLPMNLPNYQSSSQLPPCCNTVPHQYTYVQECDPHNNKNAAAIQSLCFMFLEDCKSIDKGRSAVGGKRQQQTVCNNKRGECGYYTEGGSQQMNSSSTRTTTEEDASYSEEDLKINTSKIRQVKNIHPLETNDFSQLTHVKDEITSTSYLSINDSESKFSFDRKKYSCGEKESQYLSKTSENDTPNLEKDEKNKENNVNWEKNKQEDTSPSKNKINKKNKSPESKENSRPKGQALVYNIGLQQNQSNPLDNTINPRIDSSGQLFISQMDSLSERIYDFHTSVMQSQAHLNRKLYLRDMIYYTICPLFPTSGLYIVGSSLNGFGNNGSDMDLCLMLTNRELDQRRDAVAILNAIKTKMSSIDWIRDLHLIVAKVPILRITFNAPFSNITVDLNANNSVAIKNTHLLCAYSNFDWRVRPLVSAVKEWAKRRGINDANQSTFTSYSLVLMCLHYLQCGLDTPILPSLQELYQDRFSNKCDVRNLNVVVSLEKPTKDVWPHESKATLGELLIGFLKYYAETFDFENDVISIRCGKRLSRREVMKNDTPHHSKSQWGCVCIEEPFTLMNTAHSVFDSVVFEAIKQCFVETYEYLKNTSDFDVFLSGRSIKDVLGGYTLIPPGGVIYNAPRHNGTNQLTSNTSMVYSSPETSLSNSSQEESSNEFNTNTSEVLSDNSVSKSNSLYDIEKKSTKGGSSNISQSNISHGSKKSTCKQQDVDSNDKKINGESAPMSLKIGHIDITDIGLAPIQESNANNGESNVHGKCNSPEKTNMQGTLTEQNKNKHCKKEDLNISNSSGRSKGKHRSKKGSTNNVDEIKCTMEN